MSGGQNPADSIRANGLPDEIPVGHDGGDDRLHQAGKDQQGGGPGKLWRQMPTR